MLSQSSSSWALLIKLTVKIPERLRFWPQNVLHLLSNHSPRKSYLNCDWLRGVLYIFMPKLFTSRNSDGTWLLLLPSLYILYSSSGNPSNTDCIFNYPLPSLLNMANRVSCLDHWLYVLRQRSMASQFPKCELFPGICRLHLTSW